MVRTVKITMEEFMKMNTKYQQEIELKKSKEEDRKAQKKVNAIRRKIGSSKT